jgi:hypothetical protein
MLGFVGMYLWSYVGCMQRGHEHLELLVCKAVYCAENG